MASSHQTTALLQFTLVSMALLHCVTAAPGGTLTIGDNDTINPGDTEDSPTPKYWVAASENSSDILTHSLLDPSLHYSVSGALDPNGLTIVNLDLLPDDVIAEDVEAGVQQEFDAVDRTLGEDPSKVRDQRLPGHRANRQLSPIYQGVYVPDARFNAFVDGVMVNMVAEMRRRRMDPLYFRVHNKGIVEHVPTRRRDSRAGGQEEAASTRQARQQASTQALGGGVIRGLTKIRRFGNAEVQVAGNSTLIRGHWLCGPLDLIIDYRNETDRVTRVRTGLQAIQLDSLTIIDRFGAEMETFRIISPFFQYMPYVGNRTDDQQKLSEKVVEHIFSNGSFMALLLRDAFEIASYDKIIPQFGTDSSYYSVLQYLLTHREQSRANGKDRDDITESKLASHFPLPLIRQ